MAEGDSNVAVPSGFRAGLSTALRALSLIAFAIFLAIAAQRTCAPPEWAFSVEAETQVVEMQLRPAAETRWRIDGASLCTRSTLTVDPGWLAGPSACSGRAWKGYRLSVPEPVIVLEGGVRVVFEWIDARTLAASLQDLDGGPMARLSVAGADDLSLGAPVNLIWSLAEDGDVAGLPPELVFPFTGSTTIGRDIHWSGTGVLTGGRIAVFTASDSADRRRAVDEATLMLGDQVSLRGTADDEGMAPKGFVRARLGPDGDGTLQVVAFGRAERMRVDRFGDSGYELAPSLLTRILNDPVLVLGGTVLVAFLGLIQNLQPLLSPESPARSRFWAWLLDRLSWRSARRREEEK